MKVLLRSIVEHAIELTTTYGKPINIENMPRFVQELKTPQFTIIYTTPFAKVEFVPGKTEYCIDIWNYGKKVFSMPFGNLEDINPKRYTRMPWAEAFVAYQPNDSK